MSRGDRREDIFRDDVDRDSFLQTLDDACAKTGWQVHAFCLMPNHFHLVVETPQPNLVAGMKWILGTYTARFNRRHRLSGHVFAGRYKSLLVGGEGGYLRTVCDYVHLNPVRAKLIAPESPLRTYPWSSFPLHLSALEARPSWLRGDRLFGELGIQRLDQAGCAEFEQRTEGRRAESNEEFDRVRRGWYFGGEQFRSELLAKVEGEARGHHFGAEIHEASEAKATRILDEELRRALWSEAELKLRQKGDPQKLQIARRLRMETTMTLQWIANRLHMGTKTHLSHLLYWQQRAGSENQSVARAKASAKSPGKTKLSAAPVKNRRLDTGSEPEPSPALPPAKSEPNPRTTTELQQVKIPLTDPDWVGGFDTSFD